MKPVEFHPDAAEEAREAAAHYESIRAGFGADFQAAFEGAALTRIRDNPLLYAVESGAVRVCPLRKPAGTGHGQASASPDPRSAGAQKAPSEDWFGPISHCSRPATRMPVIEG